VVVAAEGQLPVVIVEEEGVLRPDVDGDARRVGQFVAGQVGCKAAPAVGCAAAAVGNIEAYRIRIVVRERIVSEAEIRPKWSLTGNCVRVEVADPVRAGAQSRKSRWTEDAAKRAGHNP